MATLERPRTVGELKAAGYKVLPVREEMRKNLIGGGDRSERIRTYNFPQNRCTDHRIEFTLYKLDAVMAGDVDLMIQPMKDAARKEKLAAAS